MKTSFIKKITNITISVIRFLKIPIGMAFLSASLFLLIYSWPSKIYEVEGIVQNESDCAYVSRARAGVRRINTYCLNIDFGTYYLRDRGLQKVRDREIALKGRHAEILCYDSQSISIAGDVTFIVYLKVDGELIWDGRDDNVPMIHKLLVIVIISGILLGMVFYYEAKEQRTKKKLKEKKSLR